MPNHDRTPSAPGPAVRHGGRILADQLAILGAEKVFCVPGESFLGLLDGLYDHRDRIDVVTCRHESGAANMADAYGKLTGRPGICAVTRGPGATNASNGVHTAFQDSTPMILLVGQVSRKMMDREAFQEIDYRRMFGEMAKWIAQIDDVARIPEYLSRAWHVAMSGRPGPVVLALPEDVLSARAMVDDARPASVARGAPESSAIARLGDMLSEARKPLLVLGGPGWSAQAARLAADVADRFDLPVATTFRCQDYIDNGHPNYGGVIGIAPVPELARKVREEVDLLITVGSRWGEMTTQGYTLIDSPVPQMRLVHVHPGPEELGHVYAPDLSIASGAEAFLGAMLDLKVGHRADPGWTRGFRADYEAFLTPTQVPGALNMGEVIRHLSNTLPADTIYTNGAGNYAVWLHRFHSHRGYRTQLAPTSGSMGYAVPAAVAAKLVHPDRSVVSVSGDGCFLMTAQELATARAQGLAIIYLVVNNGMYGTIRMHQERNHPGRVISTALTNPDFVAFAGAFGIPGEVVTETEAFAAALDRARASDDGYLIELRVDPEALTPTQSLSAARAQGEAEKTG
ncbi:acetolactate synthase large subunit [Aliiruegeria haliotis]|uniref:Acetolactate synthase large subunit n=1 Tax=Aliiruegeria haliotis TaxID=1280846 RepID=A0A2T0RYU8_9RHOB|nr:thiamine pyrophosphate-binding protein [Aliiruegeria haliotis]PRY26320.1 acetolactate synthase large subunit [Aliiruegeria haliotis]